MHNLEQILAKLLQRELKRWFDSRKLTQNHYACPYLMMCVNVGRMPKGTCMPNVVEIRTQVWPIAHGRWSHGWPKSFRGSLCTKLMRCDNVGRTRPRDYPNEPARHIWKKSEHNCGLESIHGVVTPARPRGDSTPRAQFGLGANMHGWLSVTTAMASCVITDLVMARCLFRDKISFKTMFTVGHRTPVSRD